MMNNGMNPVLNPRTIMPTIPTGINANQDALYMLANGTGGFVIVNERGEECPPARLDERGRITNYD